MASLTYFAHPRQKSDPLDSPTCTYPNNPSPVEHKPQNPPSYIPSSQELQRFIGCQAGEMIKQMRVWGYHQVTLNIPQNLISVKTDQGSINFELLSYDTIIANVNWDLS